MLPPPNTTWTGSIPAGLNMRHLAPPSPSRLRAVKSIGAGLFRICHVSTSPSVENVDQLGADGPGGSGGQHQRLLHSRSPSPSPSSRSRSRDRRPSSSTSHATGHLAAHAFHLMVTVPQNLSNDDQVSPPTMGKLTPDLLAGNHYEADISDQSDGCLGVPQG
ncbi:uncharacterized protein LOC127005790 isoform X2 [Eriocheir sinensis]|uniref:uncharacterized protein LOC127005790 isoform X2 n=1 Tax=Eriocheir sinensis TaxID=95602 RepID=UPI0021C5E8F5|nr:uncharacterized protein LOC127005790 isoform X2 [Eriocheir sinensis]